jgi:hypothetical protein
MIVFKENNKAPRVDKATPPKVRKVGWKSFKKYIAIAVINTS